MSGSSGLSGRYAKALYELAAEKKIISKIVSDFESLKLLLIKTLHPRFLNAFSTEE